ncbi:MAG TPA: glycosyltransferase family 39 protein, partial [Pyrinomonadaceae bacterium]|nr:glycosyltransferase family 39 protein [Pyrinomonadaceae bacterium]
MSEITKTKEQSAKSKDRIVWLALALVTIAVYFFGLTIPLLGPDEPRYSQVAREMFLRGDWVTPTLGGANWFEKPALLYWLQIASYNLFGVSEFAARFGSAIFGLGTIFSLWILGRRSSAVSRQSSIAKTTDNGQRTTDDFANWLALIAASSIGLLAFSRGASFDIVLTFPMTASLVAFFIFDQSEKKSGFAFHLSLFAFYFFIGLALLAKGLIGIVFPFAIVTFYFALSRKLPNKTFIFSLFWGTIISLIIASLWYVPMYLAHGWTFIDEFFIQHHFQRFTSDKYQHYQPFWFFFLVLPLMTLPWLPFFLASIWRIFKGVFPRGDAESPGEKISASHSPLSTFAFAWLLVPLVFFTFSGSKLPGYILPALPAALVLTAYSVFEFARKSDKRKLILQTSIFLLFAVVALALQLIVPKFADDDSVKRLIETTNAKGFTRQRIVNLYTISHNAEFYAANRLVRTDGKQRRFFDTAEIVREMKRE